MRIGIMLRHVDQHSGGVKVYTNELLERLLTMSGDHEFVLMYQHANHRGRYRHLPKVRETVADVPTRLMWDQLAVPWLADRHGVDLVFNPKYSLPLYSGVPGVFVCHGLDWYVMPWGSPPLDRVSHKLLVPRYAHKAAGIIAVSDTTREHVIRFWDVDPEKVCTIYHGVADYFLRPVSDDLLARVRERYALPERFLLYVGQIYPAKNFARLVRAYAKVGPQEGMPLVVAGAISRSSQAQQLALIDELGIERWVIRTGWVDHELLPGFYAQAAGLLLPSLYEACPSPIIEAMAMSCPVVTANRYGTRDVAGHAAILVDPEDVDSIAAGITKLLSDDSLGQRLAAAGRERAPFFSWDRCARETLDFLELLATHEVRPRHKRVA
jgi:glycosyltransferase involved in cell wall biosynthesis